MRKTLLTVLGAALIAATTTSIAAAAPRHHVRKTAPASASEQFRNANNAVAAPAQPSWYSGGYSAPAGQ